MLLGKSKERVLYSELRFDRPKIELKSSASEAVCRLCGSGLKEGIGLSARKIGGKVIFVCSTHGV